MILYVALSVVLVSHVDTIDLTTTIRHYNLVISETRYFPPQFLTDS